VKKLIIIAAVVTVAVAGGVSIVLVKNRLSDAYAVQALRFLIEGEKNMHGDYLRNLHELEVQVSSPAERKSFDAIVALKTADDNFEKTTLAPSEAIVNDAQKDLDSVVESNNASVNTIEAALQGAKSDISITERAGEKLKRADVLMKEEDKTIDEYYKERQRACYEPLKVNIEKRSAGTPKGCDLVAGDAR
jgi:hypothetical protein